MLIDWFTVGAQALNFLILVWLLHRFLYKPILSAIDTREKDIAAKLAEAETKMKDAQSARGEFERKTGDFERQCGAVLAKATDDAKLEHTRLIEGARKEADTLRATQAAALTRDQARLGRTIANTAREEVISIARRTLMDLASASLEERIGEIFTRRLGEMDAKSKETLGVALKSALEPAIVRSTFPLAAQQRATIQNALNETFSSEIRLQFKTGEDTICGIELSANGRRVGWNIAGYLDGLDERIGVLLAAK